MFVNISKVVVNRAFSGPVLALSSMEKPGREPPCQKKGSEVERGNIRLGPKTCPCASPSIFNNTEAQSPHQREQDAADWRLPLSVGLRNSESQRRRQRQTGRGLERAQGFEDGKG